MAWCLVKHRDNFKSGDLGDQRIFPPRPIHFYYYTKKRSHQAANAQIEVTTEERC